MAQVGELGVLIPGKVLGESTEPPVHRFCVDSSGVVSLEECQFSSRVAEGLARRSHGNPPKMGANSCPGSFFGVITALERSGRDEKGEELMQPLLISVMRRGFVFLAKKGGAK
jgi:hypothetical protein